MVIHIDDMGCMSIAFPLGGWLSTLAGAARRGLARTLIGRPARAAPRRQAALSTQGRKVVLSVPQSGQRQSDESA
jgi:hypothetical protein